MPSIIIIFLSCSFGGWDILFKCIIFKYKWQYKLFIFNINRIYIYIIKINKYILIIYLLSFIIIYKIFSILLGSYLISVSNTWGLPQKCRKKNRGKLYFGAWQIGIICRLLKYLEFYVANLSLRNCEFLISDHMLVQEFLFYTDLILFIIDFFISIKNNYSLFAWNVLFNYSLTVILLLISTTRSL